MAVKDEVTFQHPEYTTYLKQVTIVKNIFDGVDSSKQYIAKAPLESETSFVSRQDNATLKNFVKRATEAFVGMIYRKSVDVVGFGDKVNSIVNKIDTKNDINKFSRDISTALIRDGRVFLAVDTPIGGGDPYVAIFERLSVINWRKDNNGRYSLLVVYETIEEQIGVFSSQTVGQWRVYKDDGNVDIYRKNEKGNTYLYDQIITEYEYIPVIDLELSNIPPLYDIAKLTIKHLNRTSLKDKYLDMSAIPIPLIWGASEESDGTKPAYVIGVDEAFIFNGTKEECDFQWRELSGSSIKALQEDLRVIEEDVTSGVIKAASSETTTMKTATQSFYEASESANRVTVIASIVDIGLNDAVKMIADLANEPYDELSRVIVNKDFNAIASNGSDLRLLWEMYLGGSLSIQTFLNSMESYEVIDIGSVEDEIKRIEQDNFKPKPKAVTKESTNAMDNNMVGTMNDNQQI